ncbi:MAG TPA: hypothetical protein PKH07_06475, partial [bacterium]|nr:hypothetical protein [bacterium]
MSVRVRDGRTPKARDLSAWISLSLRQLGFQPSSERRLCDEKALLSSVDMIESADSLCAEGGLFTLEKVEVLSRTPEGDLVSLMDVPVPEAG